MGKLRESGYYLGLLAGLFPFLVGAYHYTKMVSGYLGNIKLCLFCGWQQDQLSSLSPQTQDVLFIAWIGYSCLIAVGATLIFISYWGLRQKKKSSWVLFLFIIMWVGGNDLMAEIMSSSIPIPLAPILLGGGALFFSRHLLQLTSSPILNPKCQKGANMIKGHVQMACLFIPVLLSAGYLLLMGFTRLPILLASYSITFRDGIFFSLAKRIMQIGNGSFEESWINPQWILMGHVASANFSGMAFILFYLFYIGRILKDRACQKFYLALMFWLSLNFFLLDSVSGGPWPRALLFFSAVMLAVPRDARTCHYL